MTDAQRFDDDFLKSRTTKGIKFEVVLKSDLNSEDVNKEIEIGDPVEKEEIVMPKEKIIKKPKKPKNNAIF